MEKRYREVEEHQETRRRLTCLNALLKQDNQRLEGLVALAQVLINGAAGAATTTATVELTLGAQSDVDKVQLYGLVGSFGAILS